MPITAGEPVSAAYIVNTFNAENIPVYNAGIVYGTNVVPFGSGDPAGTIGGSTGAFNFAMNGPTSGVTTTLAANDLLTAQDGTTGTFWINGAPYSTVFLNQTRRYVNLRQARFVLTVTGNIGPAGTYQRAGKSNVTNATAIPDPGTNPRTGSNWNSSIAGAGSVTIDGHATFAPNAPTDWPGADFVVASNSLGSRGLENYFADLRNTYTTAAAVETTYNASVCHGSCHGACHGQRGRR